MDEFFKWLSANPVAGTVLIVSFAAIVTSITFIYVVAFIQGREISLWPPKIGAKPTRSPSKDPEGLKPSSLPSLEHQETVSRPRRRASLTQPIDPISHVDATNTTPTIREGIEIATSSGNRYTIQANVYSGPANALFRASDIIGSNVIIKMYWYGIAPNSPYAVHMYALTTCPRRTAPMG